MLRAWGLVSGIRTVALSPSETQRGELARRFGEVTLGWTAALLFLATTDALLRSHATNVFADLTFPLNFIYFFMLVGPILAWAGGIALGTALPGRGRLRDWGLMGALALLSAAAAVTNNTFLRPVAERAVRGGGTTIEGRDVDGMTLTQLMDVYQRTLERLESTNGIPAAARTPELKYERTRTGKQLRSLATTLHLELLMAVLAPVALVAGVFAGLLGRNVRLALARRLFYWSIAGFGTWSVVQLLPILLMSASTELYGFTQVPQEPGSGLIASGIRSWAAAC